MKFYLFLLLLSTFVVSCNGTGKTYIYELSGKNGSYTVGANTVCVENTNYDEKFKKSYCYKENKIFKCETENRDPFAFKEFKNKSICDSEVSVKKKENII